MKDFPVIKLVLVFSTGVIAAEFFSSGIYLNFIFLGLLTLLTIIAYYFEKRIRSYTVTSIIIFFVVLCFGYTDQNITLAAKNFLPDSLQIAKDFTAFGTVKKINLPVQTGFTFLFKADSISIKNVNCAHVRLLCRINDDSTSALFDNLHPGNKLSIHGIYRRGREDRNPGEFDYNNYLHSINVSGIVTVFDKKEIKILSKDKDWFEDPIFISRKAIYNIIEELHNNSTAALLKGLLLADRSDMSYETKNRFIDAGVVHILAVSGLHLGFIALIFYVLLGRLNLYLRSLLTITGVLSFMILTGVPPSVFRAAVMTIVVITGFLMNRATNVYNSTAIAALIILAFNPSDLFNPGFQLSFSAVLSIAYFYPFFRRVIINMKTKNSSLKNILLFSAVSVSAQIGTLPFAMFYFGKTTVISVFANLLIIPLTGFILGTSLITLVLYPISVQAASVYAAANNLFSEILFKIVEFAGSVKISIIEVHNYSLTELLFFCFFIFVGIIFIRRLGSGKSRIIFVSLIIVNIILYSSIDDYELLPDNKLSVFMIDVGQGDSFLIKFPDGETALIDAGNVTPQFDTGLRVILPLMNKLGIKKIDYGFVSHIDRDHYGGFIELVRNNKINKILKPLPIKKDEKDFRFERFLKQWDVPVEYYLGKSIRIGNAEIFILNDKNIYESGKTVTSNRTSGVLKVIYGNTSILFTGDLEKAGEIYYADKYGTFLNADVLKPGHHGSKTSSSEKFIDAVSPEISLISCGTGNRYGHPSGEVITRLSKNNSKIYRTDLDKGVLLQSDGSKITRVDWKNYY